MDAQGLTPFALVFMLVSMGTVTALMVYCFWRILRKPVSPGSRPGPGVGPGGDGGGGAGAESPGAAGAPGGGSG